MRVALVGPAEPRELGDWLDCDAGSVPVGLGGTPVTALAKGLLGLGHHVVLVTASRTIQQAERFEGDRLTVEVVPYRARARERARDFFRAERVAIRAALDRNTFDLIHAHWTYEFALAAISTKKPLVVTAHDSPVATLLQYRDLYRLIRAVMACRVRIAARWLTVVSPYLASQWRRGMRWRGEIAVIPNISPFAPQPHAPVLQHEEFRLLDIADDSRRKNIRTLLFAFDRLRTKAPDSLLTLIGAGLEDGGELASWAHRSGIAANVRFLGSCDRETIRRELAFATVFVHPSLEESQPMCLLEGLAFGLPIIAGADAGGTAWTLDEGKAGLLIDERDPTAIAAAVISAHRDPARVATLREHGFQLITKRYSEEAVATSYLRVYRQAVEPLGSGRE